MRNFLTWLLCALGLFCALFIKVFAMPAGMVIATASLTGLAAVFWANRERMSQGLRIFQAGQVRVGLFALVLFSGICATFAADFVQRNFTSLIIFPGTRAESDTNGFIRTYINSSNYVMLSTNGTPIFYLSTGVWTGYSGVTTPAAGVTQFWSRGVMVGTNLPGVAPSN